LISLWVKYPDALDEDLTPIVAKTVVLPFLLPAIIAPESFGIAPSGFGPTERKNLAAVANLITCIASPELAGLAGAKDRFVRVPLKEYIMKESMPFRDWIIEGERYERCWTDVAVASVEPIEIYFEAHELFESTLEAKPIMITRTEIYGTLSVLMKHIPDLVSRWKPPGGRVLMVVRRVARLKIPLELYCRSSKGPQSILTGAKRPSA
jgi:Ras GTPase-activating-like protein IQGAP2/3